MLDAVIVGAGLAGLSCARELHARELSVVVVEAADAVGGRVRTDVADGFRLDRGFQVLLTVYPEAQRQLDYASLDLCSFEPGAMVFHDRKFHRLSDPLRVPRHALSTALGNTLTFGDKWRMARLAVELRGVAAEQLFRGQQDDTLSYLRQYGFSPRAIERFFTPFFGGVFLDTSLRNSSRFFKYLFQCFAEGQTVVPRLGMQAIPMQLAAELPQMRILLNAQVTAVQRVAAGRYSVRLADGQVMESRAVVVATDANAANALLTEARAARRTTTVAWNGTTTFYYAAERAPVEDPILLLNGEGAQAGPVNHAAVMTNVSAAYAPAGAHLICANVVGQAPADEAARIALEREVRQQMRRWFGQQAGQWQVVGGYFLPHALPMQRYAEWNQGPVSVRTASAGRGRKDEAQEIFLCGDYCETASIQGALASGRRTAESAAAALLRG